MFLFFVVDFLFMKLKDDSLQVVKAINNLFNILKSKSCSVMFSLFSCFGNYGVTRISLLFFKLVSVKEMYRGEHFCHLEIHCTIDLSFIHKSKRRVTRFNISVSLTNRSLFNY